MSSRNSGALCSDRNRLTARITVQTILFILIASPVFAKDYSKAFALIEQGDPEAEDTGARSIAELMQAYHVPGMSMAVWEGGEPVLVRAYGVASVTTEKPVTSTTQFQAASISKPVNALAALKAVEAGRFALDDDINTMLISWQLPLQEFAGKVIVTPRMLLSHTAGTSTSGFDGYSPSQRIPSIIDVLNGEGNSRGIEVIIEPFTEPRYSGGGVSVMQLALMDAYGKPYDVVLDELVLRPAGMERSSFRYPALTDDAAHAHDENGEAFGDPWHVYPELAAAGLWTTPTDLARFAMAVQDALGREGNRVLSHDIAKTMTTRVGVGEYAVGFRVYTRGDAWYFGHGGSNWGFKATLTASRDGAFGLAIMNNSDGGSRILRDLTNRVGQALDWPGFD